MVHRKIFSGDLSGTYVLLLASSLLFFSACRDEKAPLREEPTRMEQAGKVRDSGPVLAFTGATLIDGTGKAPLENAVVIIKGNKITQVSSASQAKIPADAEIHDLTGKWILPGLIDSHVHFAVAGGVYSRPDLFDLRAYKAYEEVVSGIENRISFTLSRYLCSGVTTAIDMGGPMWTFDVRKRAAAANNAPRVAVCGPFIGLTAEAEGPTLWREDDPPSVIIRTPERAHEFVAELAERKVDMIKTGFFPMPGVTLEEYLPVLEAVVKESHANGLRVSCHVMQLDAAKAALERGIDVLAHVPEEPIDDEFIRMVLERDVIVIGTLTVYMGYLRVISGKPGTLPFENLVGDPDIISSWRFLEDMPLAKRPAIPEFVALAPQLEKIMKENYRKLFKAGASLSLGADSGNMGSLHGPALFREILAMDELGVPPMDILRAATQNGGRVLSANPDRGVVGVGKLADLLILNADPLKNVQNYTDIHGVVIDGRVLDQVTLLEAPKP